MNITLNTRTSLSLAGALFGAALAGCSAENSANADAVSTENNAEAGHSIEALPLVNRLAFMAGHVEAGLALYRAGDPKAAAPHLLHPVSETHADERKGLDGLGFDASLFEAVSKALEEGKSAAEIEPQLKAAEANLAAVRKKAGGEPELIISFLMETTIQEYAIAVKDGAVTDPGEYQDAYGFAIVAKDTAKRLESDAAAKVTAELDELIALFPEGGPIPPDNPAPVSEVSTLTSRVMLALP